jgi:hypothetical protein
MIIYNLVMMSALISNFSCISEQIIKRKNYRVRVDLLAIERSLARVVDKDKIISARSTSGSFWYNHSNGSIRFNLKF